MSFCKPLDAGGGGGGGAPSFSKYNAYSYNLSK